jgi:hypothetical protein
MNTPAQHHSVLFVGSAPPRSAAAVFEAVSEHVGALAATVPDGDQAGWLWAVMKHYGAHPQLEVGDYVLANAGGELRIPQFKLKPGVKPEQLRLGPFGYAAEAAKSYAEFKRLRAEGKFAADTRLQVTFPTPLTSILHVAHRPEDVLPAAEAAFKSEIDLLLRAVPAEDLLISWDVCEPVSVEVQRRPDEASSMFKNSLGRLPSMTLSLDSVARAGAMVPPGCGLGFHFCYGSPEDKHVLEPIDTGLLVDFMNGISARVTRPIDWMHFPVPIERDDAAYFQPLKGLRLHPETKLYLGLVHWEDGTAGATRRIKAAKTVLADFGVATECGLHSTKPENYPAMLDLHREIAQLL